MLVLAGPFRWRVVVCPETRLRFVRACVRCLVVVVLSALVAVSAGAQTLAGGQSHTLILKSDGTVWSMGYNYYGELGDGSNTQRAYPVQVSGLSDLSDLPKFLPLFADKLVD